jgi:hypothetical protein
MQTPAILHEAEPKGLPRAGFVGGHFPRSAVVEHLLSAGSSIRSIVVFLL